MQNCDKHQFVHRSTINTNTTSDVDHFRDQQKAKIKEKSSKVKLGTYPCPWAVKNDTRVHVPCWSPVYPTRPVNTGVIFDTRVHGPYSGSMDTGVILDTRLHGPWTRSVVSTEL